MIKSKNIKDFSSNLHRCMVLMLLLCFVALGVKAQESWWPQGAHATGIDKDNGVVYLNDLEDHNWTYYSGVDRSVDNGYYNDNYNGKIYRPNPRNVQIIYTANGGAVSIDEPETSFVYYKTLEQGDNEGEYPYRVISNPFSKRPTGKGFGGWKIKEGGDYIQGYNNGATLPLDADIVFEKLPYNSVNCTSAVIELEATWVPAQITYLATVKSDDSNYTFEVTNTSSSTTTYENNLLVINKGYKGRIVVNSPCTIMMVEPDGSKNYRDRTFENLITTMEGGNTKIEFSHWRPTNYINARGRNFTIGRGMVMDGTTRAMYGTNTEGGTVDQILKVESGKFTTFSHYYNKKPTKITKQWVTFGCDYDRAKNDNSKLEFTERMWVGESITLPTSSQDEICRVYSLSGKFITGTKVANAERAEIYYLRVRSTANNGHSYMEILGGEWNSIAGGWGDKHDADEPAFTFRMKGGIVNGVVYGAGEYYNASGIRTFVITGGTIKGWIAGGANGTQSTNGSLEGVSYLYIGGNSQIDSKSSAKVINRALGGNVFGAGCGHSATSTSGSVTMGTNVVIADNAYVERGVYGGGSYGYCSVDQTANIYITGGTVGGQNGGVNGTSYKSDIQGGLYGGACQNKGGHVNIFMTGGTVNGGLYGGSNASGTLSGDVTMKITGGKVGESSQKTASVYGGGYGEGAIVVGSTDVTMTGGTINGSVFGGGNQGTVGSNATVTITGGTVTGNVYGGGNQAEVEGQTRVVIGSSRQ